MKLARSEISRIVKTQGLSNNDDDHGDDHDHDHDDHAHAAGDHDDNAYDDDDHDDACQPPSPRFTMKTSF